MRSAGGLGGSELLGDPGGPQPPLQCVGTRAALVVATDSIGDRTWRAGPDPSGASGCPTRHVGETCAPPPTTVLTQPAEEPQPRGRAPPPRWPPSLLGPGPSPRPRRDSESPGRSSPRASGSSRKAGGTRARPGLRGTRAAWAGRRSHTGWPQARPGDPLREGNATAWGQSRREFGGAGLGPEGHAEQTAEDTDKSHVDPPKGSRGARG